MTERKKAPAKKAPSRRKAKPPEPKDEALDANSRKARNLEIWRAWMRGLSPGTLAQTYDLSPRTIERIVAHHREEARQGFRESAITMVEDHVLRVDGIVDELAGIAAREKGAVRVSAIMGKLTALKHRIETLQAVGVLPNDLGTLRVEMNVTMIGKQIIEIFDRYDVPAEAAEEIRDFIEGTGRQKAASPELEPAA